ncbi:pyruvate kinase [Babesia caballi]|uniref:Pyruvate kinase n=1 Tax=Babesia caballi TaxID=5871 RepID=A0AAV4LV34_BABCB|nr:pyruvate kinase [Babesia caballi]
MIGKVAAVCCTLLSVFGTAVTADALGTNRPANNLTSRPPSNGSGDAGRPHPFDEDLMAFVSERASGQESRYASENTSYGQRNVRRNLYDVDEPADTEDAIDFFSHMLHASVNFAFRPVDAPEGEFWTKTKQVSTLGPSTDDLWSLKGIMDAGTNVFRLNFAHGTRIAKLKSARLVRQLELTSYDDKAPSGNFVKRPRALLGDIQGPKLRIGQFMPNVNAKGVDPSSPKAEFVELKKGDEFTFDTNDVKGGQTRVQFNFPDILRSLSVGNVVSLDDGNLNMRVVEVDAAAPSVKAVVLNDGVLSSRKGLAVPNISIPVELLSAKDVKDTVFAYAAGLDFLGISFVQKMQDLLYIKNIILDFEASPFSRSLRERLSAMELDDIPEKGEDEEVEKILEQYYNERFLPNKETFLTAIPGPRDIGIGLIPKIEKQPALDDINGILEVSDALMVARGDLGVETDLTNLPIVQKRLVQLCRLVYRKPVIVATQMLESMRNNPMPTRAETTDCANAVYDGADAVMLSAESAVGQYPSQTVYVQRRIVHNVEHDPYFTVSQIMQHSLLVNDVSTIIHGLLPSDVIGINRLVSRDYSDALAFEKQNPTLHSSSNTIAHLIIGESVDGVFFVTDDSGELIQWVASKRFNIPLILVTRNASLARRQQLTWGVETLILPLGVNSLDFVQRMAPRYVQYSRKVLVVECKNNSVESHVVMQAQ